MAPTTRTGEHVGERPTWDCRVCTEPWPCAIAKSELDAEFRHFPSMLTIYMYTQMEDAVDDFMTNGSGPPSDLYDRFIAWVRARMTV